MGTPGGAATMRSLSRDPWGGRPEASPLPVRSRPMPMAALESSGLNPPKRGRVAQLYLVTSCRFATRTTRKLSGPPAARTTEVEVVRATCRLKADWGRGRPQPAARFASSERYWGAPAGCNEACRLRDRGILVRPFTGFGSLG